MPIEQKGLERIERIILRSTGDIAEVIGNAVERLEERIDAAESRICGRLRELDENLQPHPSVQTSEDFSTFRKAPPMRGAFYLRLGS